MDLSTKQVSHLYNEGTPMERRALQDVSIHIPSGSYYAIIGHTGSGKSTLIQHLNGLLKPTSGSVHAGNTVIRPHEKAKQLRGVRKRVGMVFQYPEHQLFEETIEKDICFGPLNFGASEQKAKRKARETLQLVGLDEEYLQRSPFELSGGQMRRVAIAGVLAMEPEVLILDEPTAGLDPSGQREMMGLFAALREQKKISIILVTHSMEDAARYAEQIIVMEKGSVFMQGSPTEIFGYEEKLKEIGLDVPESLRFIKKLEKQFDTKLPQALTLEEVLEAVRDVVKVGTRP
ncbi:energy-coupling factor ABC transporter ATP-binding protein [Alkalihalobacillus sp. AL-G]|uniref:energy-coupling factor ABC transporter ATP-binding protein n=1 Tax=Alkalihalobacillus sp. AL-G TaxID=2926399 RepID=UPI00272CF6CE|nr:energy-coupling factor ABC transporter ATP-binding protein [Alkalihalobacillus sp. AL-G]WLD93558.1 energy-coupling factor ABC transporter ATP-binding protein [Alkalihalobacillus sp. AL-G]